MQKEDIFTVVYRRFGQSREEFENFKSKFDDLCSVIKNENPYCTIFCGDFNAHFSEWWDGDNTDYFGTSMQNTFLAHGLHQIVNQPTYITGTTSSCIDLIVTDQPNMFLECIIHPSIDSNCHHQINYAKLNIICPTPPPYQRRVWHYDRANINSIKTSLTNYNWDVSLEACLNIDEQVKMFNDVICNIFGNFTPFDDILIKPKDPPWLTKAIKSFYNKYKKKYRSYIKNGRKKEDKDSINDTKDEYTALVRDAKENYLKSLGEKLENPQSGIKAYWAALKKLINGNKVSIIPPLIVNNDFITDIKQKCSIFNNFFANQCTVLETNSILPTQDYVTNHFLDRIDVSDLELENQILKHINELNINKAHGFDGISVRMIKICGTSVAKPLCKIFRKCLEIGYFPQPWKQANVIPIHKKNSKQDVKNYRPISLLPICGKILEKIIFDKLYNYVFSNNLINDRQSGFRKNDSTIKQLLSITHDIFSAFDQLPPKKVRAVFLDICKAFDKVWHSGLLFKLKRHGITGNMLSIIESFLTRRLQRVSINGQNSEWAEIKAGVPQGSILGPILFLIYINDLAEAVDSEIRIFADDTFIFEVISDSGTNSIILEQDLGKITKWANQWKMSFNPDITKQAVEVIFSNNNLNNTTSHLIFNDIPVKNVDETKHLGMVLDKKLNFVSHVCEKIAKANQAIGVMKQLHTYVPRNTLETIYKLYARPHLDYGDVIYHIPDNNSKTFDSEISTVHPLMSRIESVQYEAACVVSGAWRGTSRNKLYDDLGWESLHHRRNFRRLCIFYDVFKNNFPKYLSHVIDLCKPKNSLRQIEKGILRNIPCRTLKFSHSFFPSTIKYWNALEHDLKHTNSLVSFKNVLLKQIRPKKKLYYGIQDKEGTRFITLLRMGLSPLKKHKFEHSFKDTLDDICPTKDGIEDTEHFLLLCRSTYNARATLVHSVNSQLTEVDFLKLPNKKKIEILLFGNDQFSYHCNKTILKATIAFIRNTKRFEKTTPNI